MIVGNFRSKADREKKLKNYKDTLDLQIQLSKTQELKTKQAQRDSDLGVMPDLPPIRSVEEELEDLTTQRTEALKHLQEIMPRNALEGLSVLGNDIDELVLFNRNWAGFREKTRGQGKLTAAVFSTLWDRYKELLNKTGNTGIEIGMTSDDLATRTQAVLQAIRDSDDLSRNDRRDMATFIRDEVRSGNAGVVLRIEQALERGLSLRDVLPPPPFSLASTPTATKPGEWTPDTPEKNRQQNPTEALDTLNDVLRVLQEVDGETKYKSLDMTTREKIVLYLGGYGHNKKVKNIIPELMDTIHEISVLKASSNPPRTPPPTPSTFGTGIKKPMLIRGRGLPRPPEPERYAEFGKYRIHVPSLQKGIFNLKFKSLTTIHGFPVTPMSQGFRDFLLSVLQSGKMNMKAYRELPETERQFFNKAVRRAGLEEVLGIDDDAFEMDEMRRQLVQRFEVLRGEAVAGNDSPQLKKELKAVVVKMADHGLIKRTHALSLLVELL